MVYKFFIKNGQIRDTIETASKTIALNEENNNKFQEFILIK